MTDKFPPGEHKARITGVQVDDDKLTANLETSTGEKMVSTSTFSPDIPLDYTQLRAHVIADLVWTEHEHHEEVILGDFDGGDGVRLTLQFIMTCYRRGPWRLLVEIASGEGHEKWGCFDDQDQPTRYYHFEQSARNEAQALARILVADRCRR